MAKTKKKRKKQNIGFMIFTILLFLMFAASALWFAAFSNTSGNKIFPNVSIDGIEVGNLTRQEAMDLLTEQGWVAKSQNSYCVTVCDSIQETIDPVQAGLMLDPETALELAFGVGRSGNIFENLIYKYSGEPVDIRLSSSAFDESYIDEIVQRCADRFEEDLGPDGGYHVDLEKGEITLVKGQGTAKVDTEGLKNEILRCIAGEQHEITFSKIAGDTVCPDFEHIYETECHEVVEAAYSTDGSHTIIPEETGCTFDIEKAVQSWESAQIGETVHIPLIYTEPTVFAKDLEGPLYEHLLGACTTKYNNSGENRCNNVRLAAETINGTILFPGEEFSFNDVVGRRTLEAGYLPATAYADLSMIAQEVGGGVCQVSTTLYSACLFSFMEITDRTNHIYPPNYIRMGLDATVTIPENGGKAVDYKFVNNKSKPIKIVAYCEETYRNGAPYKTITMEIWGTLEDDDYMPVEFDNSYMNVYDYDRKIEPAIEGREGYKIKFTHEEVGFEDENGPGVRSLTHRLIYNSNGVLIDDTIINRFYGDWYAMDTYWLRQ